MSTRSAATGGSANGRQSSSKTPSQSAAPAPATSSNEPEREIIPPLDEGPETDPAIRLRHGRLIPEKYENPFPLAKRPGFINIGKPIGVDINSFRVLSWPNIVIYQYDVSSWPSPSKLNKLTQAVKVLIGNGAEKRGLISNVWDAKSFQNKRGGGWIFDGNRLAW